MPAPSVFFIDQKELKTNVLSSAVDECLSDVIYSCTHICWFRPEVQESVVLMSSRTKMGKLQPQQPIKAVYILTILYNKAMCCQRYIWKCFFLNYAMICFSCCYLAKTFDLLQGLQCCTKRTRTVKDFQAQIYHS